MYIQVQELVLMLSRAKDESDRNGFIEEFQNLDLNDDSDDSKKVEIYNKIFGQVKGLGVGTANEIEGFFNLMGYLQLSLFKLSDNDGKLKYLELVDKVITDSNVEKQNLKYKVIKNLINNLNLNEGLRKDVYLKLLNEYSNKDELELMIDDEEAIVQYLSEWNISQNEKNGFLLDLIELLNKNELKGLSERYLITYLNQSEFNDQSRTMIKNLITSKLDDDKVLNFNDLFKIQCISNVKESEEFKLLEIVLNADEDKLNDYFKGSNEKVGLNYERLSTKLKLIKIKNYLNDKVGKDLSYDDINKQINNKDYNQLENLLINLINLKLYNLKLNQINKVLYVNKKNFIDGDVIDFKLIEINLNQFKQDIFNLKKICNKTA